jgi:hypothetical protein
MSPVAFSVSFLAVLVFVASAFAREPDDHLNEVADDPLSEGGAEQPYDDLHGRQPVVDDLAPRRHAILPSLGGVHLGSIASRLVSRPPRADLTVSLGTRGRWAL